MYNHTNNGDGPGVADSKRHREVPITSLDMRRSRVNDWITGESASILRVKNLVVEAASSRSTVLILGETGTGKEPTASAIHHCSGRCKQPLIKMNCAAVPEHLLEDELFGHVKGAYTGAHDARKGRFESANGGTLFLDEIGEMSPTLQGALLRILQEREFEKLGSSQTTSVDVRIIAATNRDLKQAIKEGRFRADLYYRLAVVEIYLPPLRERLADLPLLVPYLLAKKQKIAEWECPVSLTPRGLRMLCEYEYDWPGNVRELENTIERLGTRAAVRNGIITDEDVLEVFAGRGPTDPGNGGSIGWQAGTPAGQILLEQERKMYLEALAQARGNKAEAARLLGLSRSTFRSRLKKLEEYVSSKLINTEKTQYPQRH